MAQRWPAAGLRLHELRLASALGETRYFLMLMEGGPGPSTCPTSRHKHTPGARGFPPRSPRSCSIILSHHNHFLL